MALYPKKLRSIEELKQEELLLKKQLKQLESENVFSLGSIMGGKKAANDSAAQTNTGDILGGLGNMSFIMNFLPAVQNLGGQGMKLLLNKVMGRAGDNADAALKREPGEFKTKVAGAVKSAAFELIGGYLKWKAIELSYKGVRHILQKRKEKKKLEELEEQMG